MKHVVLISGGKDSAVTLALSLQRGFSIVPVFCDTGHESAVTYEYIKYLEDFFSINIKHITADFSQQIAQKKEYIKQHWKKDGVSVERINEALENLTPTGIPFLDLCLWKGRFPSAKARFCTEELKIHPIYEQVYMPWLDAGETVISWQGVRAQESRARATLSRLEQHSEKEPLFNYRPILHWSHDDVFAFHKEIGLKPNPLYRQGMGRVGCFPCIHARKEELRNLSFRYPNEVTRIEAWEKHVSSTCKRGQSSFFSHNKTPGQHKQNKALPVPLIPDVMQWSKTSKGGMNLDLFLTESEGCQSIYGLCE